jgi:pimeloyl-ACP methyl ester carboxylesterase
MGSIAAAQGVTAAQESRALVVLVHGFGSSAQCWNQLASQLQADHAFADRFHLTRFSYATGWFQFSILRRIPRLSELAAHLRGFLDLEEQARYAKVMLVGHSQGGLVIQRYLAEELNAGHGENLSRIVQVIMISTPNLGSTLFSGLRKLLFWANPQEHSLRVLNEEISGVVRTVTERVENAAVNDDNHRQIPIKCFWGDQDRVVLAASAKAQFENVAALEGDHFSVIVPQGQADHNYQKILASILSAAGHKYIHEIDLYSTEIKIRPLEKPTKFNFDLLNRTRSVVTNNVATIKRTIRFAPSNRCKHSYALRYATRNDGFVKMRTSHKNEADPTEASRYEDNGIEATFRFYPRHSETFVLELEIYKGFEEGHCDFHMHLPGQAHYKEIVVTLDVSDYLSAGWRMASEPELSFHREDMGHSDLCRNRANSGESRLPIQTGRGAWSWKMLNMRRGVIDIRWHIEQRAS